MTGMPTKIGPYDVSGEIGRGGMGIVYRGYDPRLDRRVAIKAISSSNDSHIERFERESRVLAQLNHPNVAGIYGIEETGSGTFLILELVDGLTLAEHASDRRLPLRRTLQIMGQVARGVEAAHDAGVVHRDLKPNNIMVTGEGQAKILDFGIAKILHMPDDPGIQTATTRRMSAVDTAHGTLLGTPAYMSPEQARGEAADARTDVWSFAVILYELLVGVPLFQRETDGASLAAVLSAPVDLDAVPASTPPAVRHVLRRCLERDPALRWNSMADVRIELDDANPRHEERPTIRQGLVTGEFQITNEVCRAMDIEGLDPLTLGWSMRYADNQRDSPALLLWVPSFGGDHTTLLYQNLMEMCPCRVVTPTLIGMEPNVSVRPRVSINNQLVALCALARHLRATHKPSHILIGGASCGGTMAVRTVADQAQPGTFDGMILVDPDVTVRDCFVTSLFARLGPDTEASALDAVRELGRECESLDDWLMLHEYIVQCVGKMRSDLSPLVQQARDLTEPFERVSDGQESPLTDWLCRALDNLDVGRCFFPRSPVKQAAVGQLRLGHLASGSLDDRLDGEVFEFTEALSHLELLRPENMIPCIDAVLQRLPD